MLRKSYDIRSIEQTFRYLRGQSSAGVHTVLRIKAPKPGPTLGITVHTHGNEPSGLAVMQFLLEEFDVRDKLVRGTLYLVVNNVRATRRYLSATTEDEKRLARMTDVNMNRLPADLQGLRTDRRYEIQRAIQLLPIWRTFDVGFDIHSMALDFPAMIMNVGSSLPVHLIRGFPIDIICTGIDRVQRDKPACSFYGNPGGHIPLLAIETGQHEQVRSLKLAKACTLSLLQNMTMIEGAMKVAQREYEEYVVADSIVFPDESFELSETLCNPFTQFQRIRQDEVLARSDDGKREFLAPFDGHALLHVRRQPNNIAEEAVFLSRPVRKIVI